VSFAEGVFLAIAVVLMGYLAYALLRGERL
jgi:K+-transporting ATPase KdpF subunit